MEEPVAGTLRHPGQGAGVSRQQMLRDHPFPLPIVLVDRVVKSITPAVAGAGDRSVCDYQGTRLAVARAADAEFVLVPRRAQRLHAPGAPRTRGAAISPLANAGTLRRSRPSRRWPSTCAAPRVRIPGAAPSLAGNGNANSATDIPQPLVPSPRRADNSIGQRHGKRGHRAHERYGQGFTEVPAT